MGMKVAEAELVEERVFVVEGVLGALCSGLAVLVSVGTIALVLEGVEAGDGGTSGESLYINP